ncbi:MAG: ThiF family adenylyltransferase [Micrococcales bacterium]|nr:ThiF family adenylyltransferase [Micrococcales bacterium]
MATMRLRTGLRVLPLPSGEVQIGVDPRWAVRITGLTEAETAALQAAARGAPLPGAAPPGVSSPRWAALREDLRTAGLTHDGPRCPPLATGEADAQAWGLIDPDRSGRDRVEARQRRSVLVLGLGPTGLATAVALTAAGVGTVAVDDDRPVRSVDVGPGGYRWTDIGTRRAPAAARALHDVAPAVVTAPLGDPDLVVLVDSDAADPLRAATLVSRGIPHLSVVVGEAGALVGPLVAGPGGPCLRCLDLYRSEADPRWTELVTGVSAADSPGAAEVGVVAGLAGHLSAALALTHLDGDHRPVPTTWEITLPDPVPRARTWAPHPACACACPAGVPT